MKIKPERRHYAVHNGDSNGPTFGLGASGAGHDLCVKESCLTLLLDGSTFDMPTDKVTVDANFRIKELEVFQVVASLIEPESSTPNAHKSKEPIAVSETNSFFKAVNDALNVKLRTLRDAETEISSLEDKFEDEQEFINKFAIGDTKDVITLNVSGTTISTKRSTLEVFEPSILLGQYDDENQSPSNPVEEWGPADVGAWVSNTAGIPDEVQHILEDNGITGRELLALGANGLKAVGIVRTGTIYLLLDEIDKLERSSGDGAASLLEHSPYCFGKLLDYLRMKQLNAQNLVDSPLLPAVRETEKRRFEKTVKYFFPGESARIILGL